MPTQIPLNGYTDAEYVTSLSVAKNIYSGMLHHVSQNSLMIIRAKQDLDSGTRQFICPLCHETFTRQ